MAEIIFKELSNSQIIKLRPKSMFPEEIFNFEEPYFLRYVPTGSGIKDGKFDFLDFEEILNQSGVISTSYFKKIHPGAFYNQLSSNSASFFIADKNYEELKPYLQNSFNSVKFALLEDAIRVVNTSDDVAFAIDNVCDFLPSSTATKLGVYSFLADLDEVANYMFLQGDKRPFIFLLDEDQKRNLSEDGSRNFLESFQKKAYFKYRRWRNKNNKLRS